MNEHDCVVSDAPGGVAIECACGLRVVRPTEAQARVGLEAKHRIAEMRRDLPGEG